MRISIFIVELELFSINIYKTYDLSQIRLEDFDKKRRIYCQYMKDLPIK